jgi:hypothetical protein
MGLVSWLRAIAYGALIAAILDTYFVTAAIASGVPVPSWAYFAPTWAGKSFYQHVLAWQSQGLGRVQVNVFSFFYFYVVPTVIFILFNFFFGLFAGLPIVLANVLPTVGAPAGVVIAVVVVTGIIQGLSVAWLFDVLIAQIFGRTPMLSMIFGE